MPIAVVCEDCSKTFKLPDKYAGKLIKCPTCSNALQIPDTPAVVVPVSDVLGVKAADSSPSLELPTESRLTTLRRRANRSARKPHRLGAILLFTTLGIAGVLILLHIAFGDSAFMFQSSAEVLAAERIKTGMSYSEVVNIVGARGSVSVNTKDKYGRSVMQADFVTGAYPLTVTFTDGKVTTVERGGL